MSKASATKLDPEAQEAAAAPPPGSRRRRFAGAAAVAALVLLSLGELLLPLPDVGADDARVEIGFDGKDVLVDVDARPLAGRAWLHEVRVTRATCDVRAQAAGGALERVATVDAEFAGAGWPVRARTITREKLVARVRDVDFDVARRLASSKLLYGSVECDVVAETQLYGGLFPTTIHSNVGTAWVPTLASKQKLFKKGSPPKRVWHDLRALAALVKDSLELSIDEDGALAARWTESRAAVRLPAGVEAVTLRLPRVAYDLTGRAGGTGTLAFEGADLRFASDPTLLDLPFRATGAFAVVGGEALDAMSTRVVALNATAVDADAFFGALLGPQHAVALRWSELFTRDESAACYAARYEDLRDAFCTEDRCDTRALRRHYKHYGAAEKRLWGCRTPARRLAGAPEGAPPRRLDETGCVPDHCMTMTWDGDYTFTGCVGFDVDGKWLCAELERTRVSTGVVYEVAASAEGECCDGDVATSVFRLSATDEGGEVKLDGALVGEIAWSGEESDLSASLTASDQGVDKFSVAVAADGEASDDDAYEGGLTGAVQLTVATDEDQLLTAVTDDDQFEATLGGDLTWKKPKESTVQGCTCEGEEWTYSPWEDDYQGSTDGYRATTEAQQDFLDLCSMDEWEGSWYCLYGYESYVWDYGWYRFPRWCATDSSSCGFCDGTIADGKCWDWTEDQDEPGIEEISATTSMSLRVGDEDVVDDMTLGAEAKWGEAQDDDFAMSASFGFDEISATLATVVDVREDDNEGDVAMSFTVTDGGAELFFVELALTGATDQPSARTASGGGGLSGSATLTTRVDGEQVFETVLASAIRTDHDFYVELRVEDDAAERFFVDGKLDYDEAGDEDKALWAQLVARVDGENSVDGELDAAAKWGDASAHNFEGDATVTRAAQRLGGATEELLYVAGAWDHDDETDAGSVALELRDRGEAFDGTVSYDLTDDHYGLGIDAYYEDTSSDPRAYTLEASAAVDETHVADDVELKVVVTEDTAGGAETFYAAMTANGEADDGVSGSTALVVRVDGESKVDVGLSGSVHGLAFDSSGGDAHDIVASLSVTSDGVEEFALVTTMDGSAKSEGYEGYLTGAMELQIAAAGDDAFAAELEGDLAWKEPKESTVQGCTCTGEEWTYSPWGNDYQGSTDDYRPTTEDQQDELDVCEIDEVWGCLYGQENYIWDYGYYYGFPRWCATDSSSCGFCDGTIEGGGCWDWVQPVDGEYEDYGADAVEASMTMKLSAPESIGEPLEEVVGVALGVDACVQLDDGARNKGCRAAHADDVTITVTADLDADVDLITAAVTFDVREDDDAGDGSLSVKVGDDDVFSLEASVDAPDAVEGVGRTCFFTAFDANMRGFFGSEDMYSDMSMGLAFDDFAWFDAELADSEASMAMTGAGLGEGFTVSTWDADATQGTVDRAACDAVVDIDLSLFMASPEKRKFKADDVIAGAATFSGITAADADTAAARAVFRDAIARVTGVDKDQVRILSVSAAAAARRRLTESVTVEFEVHPRKREAASVSANLLAAEADPTIVEVALQAAAADSDDETMVALFADVKTESFTTDVERSAPKKKKKRGEDLALYAILLIAAACLCFCACGLAAYVYMRRAKDSADPAPIVEVKSIGTADESALPKAVASAAPPLMPPPPPTGRNFCSACGAPLRGAFCGNCGARA